jgi:hypothetical protein
MSNQMLEITNKDKRRPACQHIREIGHTIIIATGSGLLGHLHTIVSPEEISQTVL